MPSCKVTYTPEVDFTTPWDDFNTRGHIVAKPNKSDSMRPFVEEIISNKDSTEKVLCLYCTQANEHSTVGMSHLVPRNQLLQHTISRHSFQFVCGCMQKFSTRAAFICHMDTAHSRDYSRINMDYQTIKDFEKFGNKARCVLCGPRHEEEPTPLGHAQHCDIEHNNLAFVCVFCNQMFPLRRARQFRDHIAEKLEPYRDIVVETPEGYRDFCRYHCYRCGELLSTPDGAEGCTSEWCLQGRNNCAASVVAVDERP